MAEPWQLAYDRTQKATIRNIPLGVASAAFLPANPGRAKLTLLRPPVGAYTLTTANPAVNGIGLVIVQGGDPLTLSVEDYGDFLTKALFAISPAGAQNVLALELEAS